MWIYKLTNIVNGKSYIGKTKRLGRRKGDHISGRSTGAIGRAIAKYGSDRFLFQILSSGIKSEEKLNALEIRWIACFRTHNRQFGYNMTKGGDGTVGRNYPTGPAHAFYGKPRSEESRRKMREGCKRRPPPTTEMRRNMSEKLQGRIFTSEHRAKISQARKGIRPKTTHAMKKPKSKAHRKNMRIAFRERSSTRLIEYDGEQHPLAEWARRLGMSKQTLKSRLDSSWPIERAFNQPIRSH